MPSFRWILPADLAASVAALSTDLQAFAQLARDAYDERSEQWQEGPKGCAVDAWLDGLGDLADELDAVDAEPES